MSGRDDFVTAREAIMARKRNELGEPPTPEELLAYRDGRLDSAARERLEAKIAVDPDAARALADLAAFPDIEPGPGTPFLADEEIDAGWGAFRQRLEALPRPAPAPAHRMVPGRSIWASAWFGAAAAALLLCIGLGIGYLAGRASRPTPGSAMKPALNVLIAELEPITEDSFRAPAAPLELPDSSDALVLILALSGTEESSGYAAEILDQEGTRLWSGDGLRPTPQGTIQLSFSRGTFPPGVYRIDLFGLDQAGRKAKVGRYELRVSPDSQPLSRER